MSDEVDPITAASDVADMLQGTCISLYEGIEACNLPADLADNAAFCSHLDSLVFECVQCSWWYEPCEESAEGICNGCEQKEEEEEEEEDS